MNNTAQATETKARPVAYDVMDYDDVQPTLYSLPGDNGDGDY